MARSGPLLTEAQWKKIAPLYSQAAQNNATVVVRGSRTAAYWKGFCGFCGRARWPGPAGEIPASFDDGGG